MLKIGVQTKGIISRQDDNAWEGFRKIRSAGFERVDFNLDAFLSNSDVYGGKINSFFDLEISELVNYFIDYRKAMNQYQIVPSQMHAPYPVRVPGRWDVTQYMQTQVIPKSIVIAEVLGAPWVVIHPFKMQYTHSRREEKEENFEYFRLLIPLLKQCNVKVCFENLYEDVGGRIVEGVCADPEDAIWCVDTLNEDAGEELFGMCLDTGHLQLVKKNIYDYISRLGGRIKALHIHENNGIDDIHQMPFTFGGRDGGLDWEAVICGLQDIEFDGTLSFETFPCMNAFPYTLKEEVLSMIHEIGVYLAKRIGGEI